MAENPPISIVDDCINRLQSGQTVADCLRAYPAYADQLLPLLEAGNIYRRTLIPDAEVALSQERVRFRFEHALSTPSQRIRPRFRRIFWLMAATLIFLTLLTATTVAAQSTIPGDTLYQWKRISETIAILLPIDSDFNERRLDEIRQLLLIQREAQITFEGDIILINDEIILIADLPIEITDETRIDTPIITDTRVQVDARTTADGRIIADVIRAIDSQVITPEPTITPSASPTQTNIASATMQPSPSVMPSREASRIPDVSATPQVTNTVFVRPTVTLRPLVSATPAPSEVATDSEICVSEIPDDWVAYNVQAGDTLSEIAANSRADVQDVMALNCIDNPSRIVVGTRIYLPRQPIRPDANPTTTEAVRTPLPTREILATSEDGRDIRPTPIPENSRRGNAGGDAPTATPSRRD